MKRKTLRKEVLLISLLVFVYLLLQFIIQISNRYTALGMYKGVFTALQFGTCLLIMYVNLKKGKRVAVSLMLISVLFMVIAILAGANEALPGLFNGIFYIITVIIISRYDTRREIESRTDFITKAANRKGLFIELREKIINNKSFSIIYITLNNFKSINDTYGHAYGDELLRKILERMEASIESNSIIARIVGSEFVVAIDNTEDVQSVADKLLDVIREKFTLVVDDNSVDCYIDGYAGVSSYPKDSTDSESLVKYADIAMTEAMAVHSKNAFIFDTDMLDRINRQVHVKNLIKEGLLKDYFYLVYQPQFELSKKKLRGFETLLRMKTDDGEFISPGEFIPVAEKSALIFQIDDYVLDRSMREFRDIVLKNTDLIVSINVSAKNFADIGFVEKIKKILAATDFPAGNLEIEITEYCMVNSINTTEENIKALRSMGIQIALDDFGTGYTSLNYVASLPIDLLKIDKSLIDDIENDKKRRDFVKAVITMGQLMECEIIAEGVEYDSQINCLTEDGCDFIQGFVWGKPLMYEDATALALGKE